MRLLLLLATGCQFPHGMVAAGDAPGESEDAVDAIDGSASDATDGASAGHCGGRVWFANFSSDPTTYDQNGDGTDDFRYRGGAFPTGQLAGGEWRVPAPDEPLDTQPAETFLTRLWANVRMRGTAFNGARGAVLYLNFGHTVADFGTLMVDVKLESANVQVVRIVNVHGTTVTPIETTLRTISGFDASPIDIELEIDPVGLAFNYHVGPTATGTLVYTKLVGTTTAKWVSLTGYSTAAAFDEFRLESCP